MAVVLLHWITGATLHKHAMFDVDIQRVLGNDVAFLVIWKKFLKLKRIVRTSSGMSKLHSVDSIYST